MITLGIETSCDETALALIETRYFEGRFEYRVLASYIHSQAELHNQFGGVYPNLAKREHAKYLFPLFKQLLDNTSSYFEQKDQMIENQIFDQRIAEIREKYYSKNYIINELSIYELFLSGYYQIFIYSLAILSL